MSVKYTQKVSWDGHKPAEWFENLIKRPSKTESLKFFKIEDILF